MFSYWSSLRVHYQVDVFSCAILIDNRTGWRPESFETTLWGTKNRFEFATVKILDYVGQAEWLAEHDNPFAQVVLAQLRTLQTTVHDPERKHFKLQLFRLLYHKAYSPTMIRESIVFIDWVIMLSEELTQQYIEEITQYDEEQKMDYIPTWGKELYEEGIEKGERIGIEKGERIGIEKMIVRMLERGNLTRAEIATEVGLPLSEIKRIDEARQQDNRERRE